MKENGFKTKKKKKKSQENITNEDHADDLELRGVLDKF